LKTSVVIPVHNRWDLSHQILWDLYKTCRASIDEVLVVDDASTMSVVHDGINWWWSRQMLPLKVEYLKENVGFLKASNHGMAKASGDILILLSNDVRIQTNFIEDVKTVLSNEPKTIVGNRLIAFDSGWNTFNGRIYQYLEGWLLALTKEAWKDLGGFDEIYAPSDMEDVDLSTRGIEKGYLLLSMDNDKIRHIGGQSIGFNPEREKITIRNKELFRQKWVK